MRLAKRNSHFIGLCFALLLSSLSCKDEPTEPPKPPPPGKREYTWTIDTLSYPGSFQTLMTDIWASSSKDVYVVGHNDQPGPGTMFRFDGKSWKTTGFHVAEGGLIRGPVSLSAIYGFSSMDIWAVGERFYRNPITGKFSDTSLIIHYDGQKWREVRMPAPGRMIQGIWGPNPAEIFAAGLFGSLYRYSAGTWKKLPADTSIWFSRIGGTATEIYLLGYIPNGYTEDHIGREYLLQWQDTNFVLIDSMLLVPGVKARFGRSRILGIQNAVYSAGWGGVFVKEGTEWENILSTGNSYIGLYGTRRDHIFACGTRNTLYHYNGIDWKKIDLPGDPSLPLYGVWCSEEEVFVVGEDGNTTFMYHGK